MPHLRPTACDQDNEEALTLGLGRPLVGPHPNGPMRDTQARSSCSTVRSERGCAGDGALRA
uniref:Uncharacterized protein n=1 Tax=Oryza nivara TaxID=4536 RepID=A0A0E0G2U2_ORYNI